MSTFRDDLVDAIPSLQRFAFQLTRTADARDDLVQQTLVLALTNEEKFQPGTDIGAWARTILFRRFVSNGRRHGQSKAVPIDDLADSLVSDLPGQMDAMRRRDFWRAVEQMSEAMAAALIDSLQGYTIPEMAARLGIPLGTAKSRTSRSAWAMRAALGGEGA
jgi:RNA polymerase sigma-70 factor (ECF subfamily)